MGKKCQRVIKGFSMNLDHELCETMLFFSSSKIVAFQNLKKEIVIE